jgi:DNA-binding PadR family transcriptional regulator
MTERPRAPLAMVVLAMFREQPMHAYRVHELIKQRGKDVIVNVAQRNSVYQTIDRLARGGWIAVRTTVRDEGRPERVVYQITAAGTRTLHDWLETTLAEPAREFPQFPAALAFLMLVTPKQALAALERRAETIARQLDAGTAALAQARATGLPRLFLVDDEYRLVMARAELDFARALVADLRGKQLTWSEAYIRRVASRMERAGRAGDDAPG